MPLASAGKARRHGREPGDLPRVVTRKASGHGRAGPALHFRCSRARSLVVPGERPDLCHRYATATRRARSPRRWSSSSFALRLGVSRNNRRRPTACPRARQTVGLRPTLVRSRPTAPRGATRPPRALTPASPQQRQGSPALLPAAAREQRQRQRTPAPVLAAARARMRRQRASALPLPAAESLTRCRLQRWPLLLPSTARALACRVWAPLSTHLTALARV
jgi:hypothetical protein